MGNRNFRFAIGRIDYPTASAGAFFFILLLTLAKLPPHAEHRSRAPARRASQKIINRSGEPRTHGKRVDATMRLLCRQTLPKSGFLQMAISGNPQKLARAFQPG